MQSANPTVVGGLEGTQDFSTVNGKDSPSIPQGRFPDYRGHAQGGVTFREAIEKEAFPLLRDKGLAHLFSRTAMRKCGVSSADVVCMLQYTNL